MIMMVLMLASKRSTTMGISTPKVPQEVPVEKLRPTAMRKMMAGRTERKDSAEPLTRRLT